MIVNTANLIIQAVIRSGNSVKYSSGDVSVRSITLNYALSNAIRILADTVNVGNDSVSLQQAIDLVKSGGTVNVAAGNYAGNVEITKSLTIQGNTGTSNPGAGSSAPVVSSSTGSGNYGFRVDASGVTIRGFKFTGNYYGVRVAASNARIEQSTFWGNYAGVYVENSVENTIATYNAFLGNTRAAIINAYAPTGTGDSRKLVDASNNYWGTSNGPKRTTNSNGYYDGVYTHTRDRWATDTQTGSTYGDWVEGYVKFQSPAAQYDSIIVDADGDGIADDSDNCPSVSNADQADNDGDGAGNACDATPNGDDDGDGVDNLSDNCPSVSNADQADNDNDGAGNACDATPNGDDDGDGVDNLSDNCLTVANPDQKDSDKDGVGNACEPPVSVSSGTVIGGLDATSYFVPVTGAKQYPLGCEYTCSTFTLPNGDQVQLCSLCGNLVTFGQVGSAEMPGALGSGVSFVSALNVELLTLDGSPLETAPKGSSLTVTFVVPAAFQGKSLSVMHWDASQNGGVGGWIESTCQASGSTCTMLVGKAQHGEKEINGLLTDGLFVLVAK